MWITLIVAFPEEDRQNSFILQKSFMTEYLAEDVSIVFDIHLTSGF